MCSWAELSVFGDGTKLNGGAQAWCHAGGVLLERLPGVRLPFGGAAAPEAAAWLSEAVTCHYHLKYSRARTSALPPWHIR